MMMSFSRVIYVWVDSKLPLVLHFCGGAGRRGEAGVGE